VGGDLREYINLYRRAQGRSDAPGWLRQQADAFRKEMEAPVSLPATGSAWYKGSRPYIDQ
jgi:hypothetical protein